MGVFYKEDPISRDLNNWISRHTIERQIQKDIEKAKAAKPRVERDPTRVLRTPSTQPKANFVPSADSAAPHVWGFGKATKAAAIVAGIGAVGIGVAALLLSKRSSHSQTLVTSQPQPSSESSEATASGEREKDHSDASIVSIP